MTAEIDVFCFVYIHNNQLCHRAKNKDSVPQVQHYKYWLVARSALKNYALKLYNVAWLRPEGNILQLRGIILPVDRG